MSRLHLARDLFRAEGLRGLVERLADRLDVLRDRLEERTVTPATLSDVLARVGGAPVLDVLATPLEPRFGGVPVQLAARLPEERRLRATALLSPEAGCFTLRVAAGGERLRTRLGPSLPEKDPSRGHGASADLVAHAARLAGARIVNFEGAAGWPPTVLRRLVKSSRGERTFVLSLHDFALFCPRPNLMEEPHGSFCGYSRDAVRCGACLGSTWNLSGGFVEAWREASSELLSNVDAVVYPSEFLRRRHAALFPGAGPRLERVIAPPALPGADLDRARIPRGRGRERRAGEPFHVAYVGAYRPHKGALVFEELLRRGVGEKGRDVKWSIFGSGDPALLQRARGLGARVYGHYRAGGLTHLLLEKEIDLALLPAIWPETYALTLSECRDAGVPVLAFALGAIGDRVRSEGGGVLVPPGEGSGGFATAVEKVRTNALAIPPFRAVEPAASASRAASARADLYRTLLGEEP